jgi:Tfp pilus assembly protein PilF
MNQHHGIARVRERLGSAAGAATLALILLLNGCATRGPTTEQLAEESRRQEDRKAQAHYKLGIEHLREGQAALAIRELRNSLQYGPDDPWTHLSIAEAYRLKGHPKMAEDHLVRALALRPGFQQAELNISALYVQMARYEEAIAHAQVLLDDPTFPVPWKALVNRGYAEFKLGRIDEARATLELAIEYHPTYWQALLNLGILEAAVDNRLAALERFEQVLTVEPGPLARAEVHYRMAEVYVSLGNRDRALEHLVASASTRPSGPWGRRSEETLEKLR